METMLFRLKSFDARRGQLVRRFTSACIKFHEERGGYRVEKAVAEHLHGVRHVVGDEVSPMTFDVCTEKEAKALEARGDTDAKVRNAASDEVQLTPARGEALDLAKAPTKVARTA